MAILPLPDPGKDGSPPAPLAGALDRVLAGLGAPPAPVLTVIAEHWEDLVGPAVAAHTRPGSVRDGVLHVEVDSPAWASQLRWASAEVLGRLHGIVGGDAVHRLDTRVRAG